MHAKTRIGEFFVALCQLAVAEQVLTDCAMGRRTPGRFVSGDSRGVVFRDSTGARHQFNMSEIQSIEFNGPGPRELSAAT